MKNALQHWGEIGPRLKTAPSLLLILDFDGTLAPIAPTPDEAIYPGELKALVDALAVKKNVHVAVMSGRPLSYLKGVFENNGLFLGGNHGLELEGPSYSYRHEDALALSDLMGDCVEEGRQVLRDVPGVIIENKGLSVAFHYRQVPEALLEDYQKAILRLKQKFSAAPVRWREGKMVWEVLPRVAWDKGLAARRLLLHLGDPLPLVMGDDETDEDMFRILRKEAVTVRVGLKNDSHAEYFLPSQEDVLGYLTRVSGSGC